jgi:hypothetical protein
MRFWGVSLTGCRPRPAAGQVAGAWVGAEVAGGDEWPSTIR